MSKNYRAVACLALFAALGLAGCRKPTPAATAPAWPTLPVPAVALPHAPTPSQVAPSQVAPSQVAPSQVAPSSLCEVELSGSFTETLAADQMLAVYVANGDCLTDNAAILARAPISSGTTFFAEVFVPCGTHLSVCAARELRELTSTVPRPSTYYGKLPRDLLAVGEGEIEFKDLQWPLREGREHTFAFAKVAPALK